MNLRDYFIGQEIELRSPLMPEQIEQGIKDALRRPWLSRPFQIGPAGGIWLGRIRLRYQSSFFEYNAKPILIGRVERTPTGSTLRLVYRGRTWFRAFFLFWYVFLAIILTTFAILGTDPPLHGAERLFPFAIMVALAVFPFILHAIGTRNSDDDLDELIVFLGQVADARRGTSVLQRSL